MNIREGWFLGSNAKRESQGKDYFDFGYNSYVYSYSYALPWNDFRRKYEEYEEDLSSGIEFTSSRLKTEKNADYGVTQSAADYPPVFQLRMRSHVVPAGMSTKISAYVRGRPDPNITWYKNGTELASGGTKYHISNIGGELMIYL